MKSIKTKSILIILTGLVSCMQPETARIEREGEPTIYGVTDSDAEMNQAIKTARSTLDEFDVALKSNNPDFHYFAVKTRFNTQNGGEHIWITGITLRDNQYFGVVENVPEAVDHIALGDTIQIVHDNISDWMYIDDQKLIGGYTIRLLRKRMTEDERKQFDAANGFQIED